MKFDYKNKSKLERLRPALLTQTRLITPEDPELLQELKLEYSLVDENSDIFEKAILSLTATILFQKRLYFALSRREMLKLVKTDPNLGLYVQSFSPNTWPKILEKCYNQFGLMSLYQQGLGRHASMYRVENQDIANFLLSENVDAAQQKAETLEFITTDFTKVSKS